ncbi:unnamed protein product [Miscanthus lutarioriparius]|uniref:serine--tRNA ligase n=1 Tax=Miscanthus lutarioriparius TaxID=422564 RepID=A0A811SE07_9POAL|nr:unnamed protein product [Miscanthus lutarioriparius]
MKHGANCGSTWTRTGRSSTSLARRLESSGQAEEEAQKLMDGTNESKKCQAAMEAEEREAKAKLEAKLMTIGNILHESVPVSDDEANNVLVRGFGERRVGGKLMNHVDLCIATDIVEFKKGVAASGGRGFYLLEEGALLNEALQRFCIAFLRKRGYKAIRTPHIMTKEAMGKCAQLSQYDEELYKVEGEGKFFIATAEQPLAVLHQGEQFHPDQLPIRYVGFSTCFRKEAGSHEFEKVEQFCITSPDGNDSWEMHEEMIAGHVVSVVSGALNNSAAKKYDLQGTSVMLKLYRLSSKEARNDLWPEKAW